MENNTRKAVSDALSDYCYFATEHAFIEITEWTNGDGVDICIESTSSKTISLTWGELKAIKKMVKFLNRK